MTLADGPIVRAGFFKIGLAPRDENDTSAKLAELDGDRAADTPAGAGYDCDLI